MIISLLIADDHPIVRKGLSAFLETKDYFNVVGEAKNGIEAVELAKELKPDVIIMDLNMPLMNGTDATKIILHENPDTKVMILTSFCDQEHVIPALEAGAGAYQLKESDPEKLAEAIMNLVGGMKVLDAKVTNQLLNHLQTKNHEVTVEPLTPREKEVLAEIAKGKSNKEIAAALNITEKTVKTHVSNLLGKLQLQDRTQAALYAIRQGICD